MYSTQIAQIFWEINHLVKSQSILCKDDCMEMRSDFDKVLNFCAIFSRFLVAKEKFSLKKATPKKSGTIIVSII